MMVLQMIGEGLGVMFGSMAVAAVFCWMCWSAFKLLHHPELGSPVGLAALLLLGGDALAHSSFLRLSAVFAGVLAITLWFVGRAWRRDFLMRSTTNTPC